MQSFLCALTVFLVFSACRARTVDAGIEAALGKEYRSLAYDEDFRMLYRYDFGAIGQHSMKSYALPWSAVASSLLIYDASKGQSKLAKSELPKLLKRFGFIYPDSVGNLYDQTVIAKELPMGLVQKSIKFDGENAVNVVNIGCVACHGAPIYDKSGVATNTAWVGLPNTSINLDAYYDFVYQSLKYVYSSDDRVRQAAKMVAEQFDDGKYYSDTIHQLIKNRISEFQKNGDRALPFFHGGPGNTNGMSALKYQFDLPVGKDLSEENGFASIPDLSRRGLRSSILYDGAFSSNHSLEDRFAPRKRNDVSYSDLDRLGDLVSFFAMPTMGQTLTGVVSAAPSIRRVVRALNFDYRPPPFPGFVNQMKAERGQKIFDSKCASCHGTYEGELNSLDLDSFPNHFVKQVTIGSDPLRWQSITPQLMSKISNERWVADAVHPERFDGYVAPILSGLWATAPYLHNGSVPTLYHFLHPDERPQKFYVGGHRLNYETVGIDGTLNSQNIYDYPPNYEPWSAKILYDTTQPGKRSTGHEDQISSLIESEKTELLEFLKLL